MGVFTKVHTDLPRRRIQSVDTRISVVGRVLGLESVVISSAGGEGEIRIGLIDTATADMLSTELTPDEIHRIGLAEVDRVRGELAEVFAGLGLPNGEMVGFSMNRVGVEGGTVANSPANPDAVIDAYGEYLDRIEPLLPTVFGRLPAGRLEIQPDPFGGGGGYYSPGSLDGTRPGVFYAGTAGVTARSSMPTLLHHEGVPGHHLQLTLAGELGLPLMRAARLRHKPPR